MSPFPILRTVSVLLLLGLYAFLVQISPLVAESAQKALTPYPDTPEKVVDAYVKAGFEVGSVKELAETSDVDSRLQYYEEPFSPGYDCWPLVLNYTISTVRKNSASATIKVTYVNIGAACSGGLVLEEEKEEVVLYHLEKHRSRWRISFPYGPPYVSVKTALAVYEHDLKEFPDRKNSIEKAVAILKKLLQDQPATPK